MEPGGALLDGLGIVRLKTFPKTIPKALSPEPFRVRIGDEMEESGVNRLGQTVWGGQLLVRTIILPHSSPPLTPLHRPL